MVTCTFEVQAKDLWCNIHKMQPGWRDWGTESKVRCPRTQRNDAGGPGPGSLNKSAKQIITSYILYSVYQYMFLVFNGSSFFSWQGYF